jgi:hypothetical protein
MPKPEAAPFTDVAMATLSLGIAFSEAFHDPASTAFPYRVQLVTPEGTSTAGGKHAAARIELVHADGALLLIGTADVHERKAMLVPYAKLAGPAPRPSPESYEALAKRLELFLSNRRLAVEVDGKVRERAPSLSGEGPPASTQKPSPGGGRTALLLALALAVVVGVAIMVFALR